MAGFHKMDSNTARAAEGVMTSYETRSTFISGRVKQAKGPATSRQNMVIVGSLENINQLEKDHAATDWQGHEYKAQPQHDQEPGHHKPIGGLTVHQPQLFQHPRKIQKGHRLTSANRNG
jgi:hypothetical protein